MNNPPYQPYSQAPPGRPMQSQAQGPPSSNSFRPFNPGQQPPQMNTNAPPQQFGQQPGPPRPMGQQGPPSSGGAPAPGSFGSGPPSGMSMRPPQMLGQPRPGFGAGPPSGPPTSGGAPPAAGGFAPPPQQQQQPQQQPPPQAFGAPRGFPPGNAPPASQPAGFRPMGAPPMGGPASAGAPPMNAPRGPPGPGMQPPASTGMRGPPPMGGNLNAQFSQMSLGAPPTGPPPMGGAPPAPKGQGPPGPGSMPPRGGMPGMPNAGPPMGPPGGMNAPMGAPPMGTPGQGPKNYSSLPSGNFQQPTEMMDGYGQAPGQPLQSSPISDELMASQCDPRYMRMTVNSIPHSQEHANKSNLTIGVVIRPMAPPAEGEDLDVVNFGPTGVVRCRHCRTYVNPFVQWVDNGRRWRCNLCGVSNDVASAYFCHLGANQQRQDREERPELNSGTVEIVAPSEYMMRPPQPPCYVFVIDVSAAAVSSGMVHIAVETIKEQLDNLPGSPRTRVGFITYDNTVHFYNLKSTLKAPQVMVIADLEELFIPIPDELLVNLSDSRAVIDTLLATLPVIHQNARTGETALGPAVRVAFKLMSSIGGKMLVFQSSLPSAGQGALRNRENPRALGTDKEHNLLNPADTFYRSNAIDFCRQQVSVDTFLFSSQYTDVASLGSLSKFSAGQLYYYPAFTAERDGEKFKRELAHNLTRETGWEAVMRVRCTKGMRLSNFYGNSFLRGPDLLALPSCNADSTFAVEIVHSDALLSSNTISVQAALLYTNSGGERRIRVHTLCIPVTKLFAELFRSADVDALCNIMAKNALEASLKTGLDSARSKLQNQCAEILRAYRNSGSYGAKQGSGYQLHLPESLQLLPLYVMGLIKNSALRGGMDLNVDERCYLQYELNNMPVTQSRVFIYPRLFALHNMPPAAGLPPPDNHLHPDGEPPMAGSKRIVLPPVINLSIERLTCDGAFLLEDSLTMYLWIGRSVSPAFLQSLFGLQSMDGVDCKQLKLLAPHDDLSRRIDNILTAIREDCRPFMNLVILREGDPAEGRFFWKLVEDRASFPGGSFSYSEFLGQINRQSMAGSGGR